jgi:hypothetical protein
MEGSCIPSSIFGAALTPAFCLVFSVEAHLLEFNAPFVASSSLVKDCSVGALFPLPFEGLDGPSVDPLSRDARQHG